MSNSSRIEAATRQHVGATLTNEQIIELVKLSDPNWKGGIYPSDAAYTRTPEGLVPRGKTAYGDGVLEYLGPNSFKVLKTDEIVRRPQSRKPAAAAAAATTGKKAVAATPAPAEKAHKTKKASGSASQPPVATKQKAREARL